MKKIVRTTLAVSIALALTACNHNDDAVTVTPATVDLAGSVVKGALIDAKVQIYRASDTAFATPLTTEPVDVQTDENGDYTATVVDASGEAIVGALVVNITADDNTQMRCDAAVSCGEVLRGELIPTSEIADISVSTLTVAAVDADGASIAIDADANTLTTMATDAVLAQVAANTNLDIDNLPVESVVALQKNASLIVGKSLGIDLSTTNIYDIKIVDATDTQAVADAATNANDAASITNTLTLVNASLAAITVPEGSTLADSINSYVQNVAVVSEAVAEALAEGTDIANALAAPEVAAAQVAVAETQVEISDEADLIKDAVVADAANEGIDVVVETEVIPDVVPAIEIDLGDIIVPTGATGGTN